MPKTARFGLGLNDSDSIFNAKFDNGTVPAVIGLNNNNILVEMHETNTVASTSLRYCVSKVSDNTIAWGTMHSHTNGRYPAIAINDNGVVIELHQDSGITNNLYWSSGMLNSSETDISWNTSGASHYDDGYTPSVALMNDGTVIATRLSSDGTIHYNIGSLSGSSLNWNKSSPPALENAQKARGGYAACVAVCNEHNKVVIVYQATNNKLYYHVGEINSSRTSIDWRAVEVFDDQSQLSYGEGFNYARLSPSVSINDDNEVVITSYSGDNTYADSTATGVLFMYNAHYDKDTKSLIFDKYYDNHTPIAFDNGARARVAINTEFAVQVHDDNFTVDASFYGTMCKMLDRVNLMSVSGVLNRPLWKVSLLGTHDSCTYSFVNGGKSRSACAPSAIWDWPLPAHVTPNDTCRAQQDRMLDQLRGGVRYVDIRVCKNQDIENPQAPEDYFYTYHAIIAVRVADVLDDIALFMQEATSELVIVNFSHLCDFSDTDHQNLINMANRILGSYLSDKVNPASTAANVYAQDIQTLLTSSNHMSSKIIIVYQDQDTDSDGYNVVPPTHNNYLKTHYNTNPESLPGFITTLNVYDCYSKTNSMSDMHDKQLRRMHSYATAMPASGLKTVTYPTTGSSSNPDLDNNGDCVALANHQLYLLSWTLTESGYNLTGLHNLSTNPSRNLASFVYSEICSDNWVPRYLVNVLYIDFYSDARGADMVYLMNVNMP